MSSSNRNGSLAPLLERLARDRPTSGSWRRSSSAESHRATPEQGRADPLAHRLVRAQLFGEAPPHVGPYVVVRLVGEGGMGVVYEGHDDRLNRRIALKMLHIEDAARQERLMREARALARLSHPNVVHLSVANQGRVEAA